MQEAKSEQQDSLEVDLLISTVRAASEQAAKGCGQLTEQALAPLTLKVDALFQSTVQPLDSLSTLGLSADTLTAALSSALDVPSGTIPTSWLWLHVVLMSKAMAADPACSGAESAPSPKLQALTWEWLQPQQLQPDAAKPVTTAAEMRQRLKSISNMLQVS